MMVTKHVVAGKILSYLQHQTTLEELVNWAENALIETDFPEKEIKVLTQVLARLGMADTRAFGLSWKDCEGMIRKLGFSLQVQMMESAA